MTDNHIVQAMVFAQHPYGPAMMAYPGAQFGMPMAQYTMGPPPYPMAPPGAGFPQQQQFMPRAPQAANNNLFYKTRMCNKWRTGACPFGDKCTYAHGQHEIRRVPAEVVAAHAMQIQQVEMNDGGYTHQPQGNVNTAKTNDEQNKSQLYYKTRLCIRFMQSGYCVKGNECTFAHGYEDLRLMGSSSQRTGADTKQKIDSDDRKDEHITEEQARARAMSAIAGVGHAEKAADPETIKQATVSIEDGTAFEGGPYSDKVL